jgi:hypothetical protein
MATDAARSGGDPLVFDFPFNFVFKRNGSNRRCFFRFVDGLSAMIGANGVFRNDDRDEVKSFLGQKLDGFGPK